MDMKRFVLALTKSEKHLLRELLREEKLIAANVPTAISNLINAGDLRTASRQLAIKQKLDLKVAWDTCIAYQHNLPKWEINYTLYRDDFDFKPLETPRTATTTWYGANEDIINKRFKDSWQHMPEGGVVLDNIKRL